MIKLMPHKHADLIIAWANGEKIQYRYKNDLLWINLDSNDNVSFDNPNLEWQKAPITLYYRVGLFCRQHPTKEYFTRTIEEFQDPNTNTHFNYTEYDIMIDFVRWLTDWVKVEC